MNDKRRAASGYIFGVLFALYILLGLGITGIVIWAIIRLVLHFT